MRARAAWGGVLASVGILLLGWQVGASVTATAPSQTGGGTSSDASSGSTAGSSTTTAPASTDGAFTGDTVGTRFGDVQVQVTIAAGSIADVTALQLTDSDGRSVQISNRAAPILRQEVVASQSANVANVSGATYTTRAYLASLQSALDQAGF